MASILLKFVVFIYLEYNYLFFKLLFTKYVTNKKPVLWIGSLYYFYYILYTIWRIFVQSFKFRRCIFVFADQFLTDYLELSHMNNVL